MTHAVALLEVAAGRERLVPGAGEDHATKSFVIHIEAGPQLPQLESHLRVVCVGDLRTVHGDQQDVFGHPIEIEGFVG